MALWLAAHNVQQLHDALASDGVHVVQAPTRGPSGLMFTFHDPGYAVTIHDQG